MRNRALSVHKEHEVLLKLEEAGLGDAEAQAIIQSKDNKLAQQVVAFIRRGGREIGSLAVEWQNFYQKYFNLTVDFSGVKVPPSNPGFDRVIYVAQGLTLNQVYQACEARFKCWSYYNDLNKAVSTNDRTPEKSYAIRIRDRQEADEELRNLSANQLKEKGISGITLLERLILELKYYDETGKHLDVENITLCSGSRHADGDVPWVDWFPRWDGDRLYVYWYDPDGARGDLRSRQAVS